MLLLLSDTASISAFQAYIQGGGGFVGGTCFSFFLLFFCPLFSSLLLTFSPSLLLSLVHSAIGTYESWPWFLKLVGAGFRDHPGGVQTGTAHVEAHQTTINLPDPLVLNDEWFNFDYAYNPMRETVQVSCKQVLVFFCCVLGCVLGSVSLALHLAPTSAACLAMSWAVLMD